MRPTKIIYGNVSISTPVYFILFRLFTFRSFVIWINVREYLSRQPISLAVAYKLMLWTADEFCFRSERRRTFSIHSNVSFY